jgi:hypothetical protein
MQKQSRSLFPSLASVVSPLILIGCLGQSTPDDEATLACLGASTKEILIRRDNTPYPNSVLSNVAETQSLLTFQIANCSERDIAASSIPIELRGVGQPFIRNDGTPLLRSIAMRRETEPESTINLEIQGHTHAEDVVTTTLTTSDHPLAVIPARTTFETNAFSIQGYTSMETGKCDLTIGSSSAQFPWKHAFTYTENGDHVPEQLISGGSLISRIIVISSLPSP